VFACRRAGRKTKGAKRPPRCRARGLRFAPLAASLPLRDADWHHIHVLQRQPATCLPELSSANSAALFVAGKNLFV